MRVHFARQQELKKYIYGSAMCTFNDFKNLWVSIVLLFSQASERQFLEVATPQKSQFRQLKKLLV